MCVCVRVFLHYHWRLSLYFSYFGKCHPAQEPESYSWNVGFAFVTGVYSSRNYSSVNVLQLCFFCVENSLPFSPPIISLNFRGKEGFVSSEQQRLMAYCVYIFISVLLSIPDKGASDWTVLWNRLCFHLWFLSTVLLVWGPLWCALSFIRSTPVLVQVITLKEFFFCFYILPLPISVDDLSSDLSLRGVAVQSLHGDREQCDREEALQDFRDGMGWGRTCSKLTVVRPWQVDERICLFVLFILNGITCLTSVWPIGTLKFHPWC